MKFLFALLLASLPALAQQTMECKTLVGVVFTCNGTGSPNDGVMTNFVNMPNPAYIVRACMTALQGTPFPGAGQGLWSMAVDRDSMYVKSTGYPASQANANIDRLIQIGRLEVQPGKSLEQCMTMPFPVKFQSNVDKILYNFDCVGGFMTQPIVQICWVQ